MASTSVQFREPQRQAIDAVRREWDAGHLDTLVVMATGVGKTHTMLGLVDHELGRDPGARILLIAHRKELIDQPIERIQQYWPEHLYRAGKVMAEHDDADRQIVVATVQTLASEKRLERLLAHGPFTHLLIDEAHHAVSDAYREIVATLRAANPRLRHLGVTATARRSDKRGLKAVYGTVAYKFGIREAVRAGYLVPFEALGVRVGISLKAVKKNKDGDYQEKSLAEIFETQNAWDLVVETHKRYAADRKAIAFTVSVKGAQVLAKTFKDNGIRAEAIHANTSKDDRAVILHKFRQGDIQVLCNCAVLTEGFDCPDIRCVHWARPTQSDLIYIQGIGRGLRTAPGKTDCLIVDYAPIEERDVIQAGDLLGKAREQKAVEARAAQAGTIISSFSYTGEGNGIDGDPDQIVTQTLDYLADSDLAWYFSDGISTLDLGERDGTSGALVIMPGRQQAYGLVLIETNRAVFPTTRSFRVLRTSQDFGDVAEFGRLYAQEHGSEHLTSRKASWRTSREEITERQLGLLAGKRPDFDPAQLRKLTKGEASKLITHCLVLQALQGKGWLARAPASLAA